MTDITSNYQETLNKIKGCKDLNLFLAEAEELLKNKKLIEIKLILYDYLKLFSEEQLTKAEEKEQEMRKMKLISYFSQIRGQNKG